MSAPFPPNTFSCLTSPVLICLSIPHCIAAPTGAVAMAVPVGGPSNAI